MIRYVTSGESHGKCLTAILEGIPSGLKISEDDINGELARRQKGYGRGDRMKSIERDAVSITSGVRQGRTIGSPITVTIPNRDWENWKTIMSVSKTGGNNPEITRPRPGHADLAGILKFDSEEIRDILERSSARETAARVAVGSICKKFLSEFGIKTASWVNEIGGVKSKDVRLGIEEIIIMSELSQVRCLDKSAERAMIAAIEDAKSKGDTVGGIFTVLADGIPVGLGSHTQWDLKLDSRIAGAMMSLQAIKGVEIGRGFELARMPGSLAHDEIFYEKQKGFYRKTNNAGGIEGGISNGEQIVVRAAMKPIPSLTAPLRSVDINTKKPSKAQAVRSDVCAVPSAAVIGEAITAIEIAKALS